MYFKEFYSDLQQLGKLGQFGQFWCWWSIYNWRSFTAICKITTHCINCWSDFPQGHKVIAWQQILKLLGMYAIISVKFSNKKLSLLSTSIHIYSVWEFVHEFGYNCLITMENASCSTKIEAIYFWSLNREHVVNYRYAGLLN